MPSTRDPSTVVLPGPGQVDSSGSAAVLSNSAPSTVQVASPSAGAGLDAARSDHVHAVSTAAPSTTLSPTSTNALGSGSSLARADHTHAIAVGTTAATFAAGNDARFTDDRTASGIRSATTIVSTASATAPSANQVLVATGANAASWQDIPANVPPSRTITAGNGLTGGGDLTANRTLSVVFGASGTTACVGDDTRLSNDRTASGLRTSSGVVTVSTATAPTPLAVLTAQSSGQAAWAAPAIYTAKYFHQSPGADVWPPSGTGITIDGVNPVAVGDRVLMLATAPRVPSKERAFGIWVVGTGAWTRAEDCPAGMLWNQGTTISITHGTRAGDKFVTLIPITLDTTLVWTAAQYSWSAALKGAVGGQEISATQSLHGSSDSLARADHTHWHGVLAGQATPLHAPASSSVAGFMSSGDKSKLDAVVMTGLTYISYDVAGDYAYTVPAGCKIVGAWLRPGAGGGGGGGAPGGLGHPVAQCGGSGGGGGGLAGGSCVSQLALLTAVAGAGVNIHVGAGGSGGVGGVGGAGGGSAATAGQPGSPSSVNGLSTTQGGSGGSAGGNGGNTSTTVGGTAGVPGAGGGQCWPYGLSLPPAAGAGGAGGTGGASGTDGSPGTYGASTYRAIWELQRVLGNDPGTGGQHAGNYGGGGGGGRGGDSAPGDEYTVSASGRAGSGGDGASAQASGDGRRGEDGSSGLSGEYGRGGGGGGGGGGSTTTNTGLAPAYASGGDGGRGSDGRVVLIVCNA